VAQRAGTLRHLNYVHAFPNCLHVHLWTTKRLNPNSLDSSGSKVRCERMRSSSDNRPQSGLNTRLRQIAFTNWNLIWLSQLIGVYGIWLYTLNTADERFLSKKATVTK